MKNFQKGFVVPLIIILAVLIAGGAYFYVKSRLASVSVPSTSVTETPVSQPQTQSQAVKGPNTAKADDSSISSDIKQLAMMAEQFYSNHNLSYVGFCSDTYGGVDLIWKDLVSKNVGGQAGVQCKANASGYVISSTLNSGAYACANSAVSVRTNLATFPTGMDCTGGRAKASASPAGTPSTVSGSTSFNAKVIGGTLSKADRDAIIAGTMTLVSALNSGDAKLFRKYAAIITSPDQMNALNKMSDQQLLPMMSAMGKTASKDLSPTSLSSANATWTIIDSNNVSIRIQVGTNVSETIQGVKINGVWY